MNVCALVGKTSAIDQQFQLLILSYAHGMINIVITCFFVSYIDQIVPGSFKKILNFKLPK